MQADPDEWNGSHCRRIASRIYRALLCLYPKSFRRRFGSEMKAIFAEALDERAQQGSLHLLVFLVRELLEAPTSILCQHMAEKTYWLRPYPMNLLAFTLGFLLIGLVGTWHVNQGFLEGKAWIYLFSLILAGGISGLAIGGTVAPHQKKLFAVSGAAGLLLANTLFGQWFCTWLVPLFYPLLMGGFIGLFLWFARGSARIFLRWTGMGGLALLAGIFVNRLSSALIQSYIFHSPIQDMITTGITGLLFYVVIPYLLEGMLLGTLFSGLTPRKTFLKA